MASVAAAGARRYHAAPAGKTGIAARVLPVSDLRVRLAPSLLLLVVALNCSGPAEPRAAAVPAGVYALVMINGARLPYGGPHVGLPRVLSDTIEVQRDGGVVRWTTFESYGIEGGGLKLRAASHVMRGACTPAADSAVNSVDCAGARFVIPVRGMFLLSPRGYAHLAYRSSASLVFQRVSRR